MLTFNDLKKINNPGAYVNTETSNLQDYKSSEKLKVVVASTYAYEDATQDEDLNNMYSIINSQFNSYADKVYAPNKNYENLLLSKKEVLISLDGKRPLNEYDVIIFSVQDELSYTNLINILSLGNVENTVKRRDRARETRKTPFVFAIGKCFYKNEDKLSKFVDVLLNGEPELVIPEVLKILSKNLINGKENILDIKSNLYEELIKLDYVYIKGLKEEAIYKYDENIIYKTNKYITVPSLKTKGNKSIVRVTKGCNRQCVNCMSKSIYGKQYEKETDFAISDSLKYINSSGMRDLSILSNCYADYSNKKDLVYELKNEKLVRNISFGDVYIDKSNINMIEYFDNVIPEIKIDSSNVDLRISYGNSITNEDIYDISRDLFKRGYNKIKIICTLGIPKENYEDIGHIYEIANKIIDIYFEVYTKLPDKYIVLIEFEYYEVCRNTESLNTKFNTREQLELKERYIKDKEHNEYIKLHFQDRDKAFLKNVIRAADQNFSEVIFEAYNLGCRFDYMNVNYDTWSIAMNTKKFDLKSILM